MNPQEITSKVGILVKSVGAFLQNEAQFFNADKVETKSLNQLVSYVDKTAEEKLVAGLKIILPEAGFITEEETIATEQKEFMWVIDPLDGTTNFIHQLPIYSISVALMQNNEPIIGVVFEPNRHELFYAWKDGGAYLNGHKISVSQNNLLKNGLLATGFPYYDFEQMQQYLDTLKTLLLATRGLRRMGSAAVDLAYVACGRVDAFWECGLSIWDVAAGALLVREAGGIVTHFERSEEWSPWTGEILASNVAMHPTVLTEIKTL